ncbi:MAG: hypothetical protein EOP52_08505 [Sphingobacteriales bacterium]|nr:MAG: hypothetical protein EOP52_08505 [Sphingobacteriales bacterium]
MKRILLYGCTSALLLAGMIQTTSCKKESDPGTPTYADYSINPSMPDSLTMVISFGDAKRQSGALPVTASTGTITISYDPSLTVSTGGSKTFLPIVFQGSEAFTKVLLSVTGATKEYFVFDAPNAGTSGTFFVPMTIPKSVTEGNFSLDVLLQNDKGDIVGSKRLTVPVKIKKPYECATGGTSVSGSSGITQTLHALNGKAGDVSIAWNTYSIPDRIDVFVDGVWKAGTGSTIAPPPPLCPCSSPLPGFVGSSGTFTVPVTADNKAVEVYVSGCTGSGTAWDYNLKCAQ